MAMMNIYIHFLLQPFAKYGQCNFFCYDNGLKVLLYACTELAVALYALST